VRIGLFHTTLPEPERKVGGVEVFVHRLANKLAARGHATTVYSVAAQPPADAHYTMRRAAHPALGSPIARLTLLPLALNRVDWSGLDVLSLHGDDWFFFRRPLPTVRTFYGSALYEARSATSLRRKLSQRMLYPAELLSSRLADRSYTCAPQMPRGYRLDGKLRLAVEAPGDGSGADPPRSERPTVLFVGTWNGRKRGRFLRDVFAREVLPKVPGAELWMVTDRCDEGPGVRWMGHPTDDELAALYRRSWVFCLPSTYEAFGIPYVEAMSHGVPVVATPNPGARWVTDDGRAGALAHDDALGPTITGLLLDPGRRARYSAAGLDRAKNFSWDRTCAEHENAFEAAIGAFGANPRRR
jgi:glycosyltransferase involved in cell wall biosynthesis